MSRYVETLGEIKCAEGFGYQEEMVAALKEIAVSLAIIADEILELKRKEEE